MKFLPFLLVCTWLSAQNQKFTLNGECQDCPDQFVYISQMSENGEIIDTVKLVDGKFYFEKKIKYEEWYQIRCQNKKKDGILELFTNPTEQVKVSFKAIGKMYHAVVKGSPASIDRFNYINGRSIFVKEKDILLKMKTDYEESKIPTPINLLNKIDSLDAEIEDITFKTIMKTSSLLLKDLCLIGIKSPLYFNLIRNYLDSLKNSKEGSHDFENLRKSFHHYSERSLMEDNPQVEKFTMNFDFLSNVVKKITCKNIGTNYELFFLWPVGANLVAKQTKKSMITIVYSNTQSFIPCLFL